MKHIIVFCSFMAVTTSSLFSQMTQLTPAGTGIYSGINSNQQMLLTQSEINDFAKGEVTGSPYWEDNWRAAILYTDKLAILVPKVKLDLYKNEVYYLGADDAIMIAKKGEVKGIRFFKNNDTTEVLANFVYLKKDDDKVFRYHEIMNVGEAQLVKLTVVSLNKHTFDPFEGKYTFNYASATSFYIYFNAIMTPLKGLDKAAILKMLRTGKISSEWLSLNHNKLKSPAEILSFINFYNSIPEK